MRLHVVTIVVDDYDDAIAHYVGDHGFTLLEDTQVSAEKRWVRVSPDPAGGRPLVMRSAQGGVRQAKSSREPSLDNVALFPCC